MKKCPICKKDYIKQFTSISPSGYVTKVWEHGQAEKPLFNLGNISFKERFSCSQPLETTEEQRKFNSELYKKLKNTHSKNKIKELMKDIKYKEETQ